MLAAIRPDTHVVWIANPNNPTGNFLPQAEVRAFIEKIPAHVAVVLDEAYTDYLAPADRADTVAWIKDFPNLLVQYVRQEPPEGLLTGWWRGVGHMQNAFPVVCASVTAWGAAR